MTLGRVHLASAPHDVIKRQTSGRNNVSGGYKAANIIQYKPLRFKLRWPLCKAISIEKIDILGV